MLRNLGESGGPEEDRTPDLFIAKVAAIRYINDLRRCSNVENSPKMGGESTNWAQSATPTPDRANPRAPNGPLWDHFTDGGP